MITLDRDEAENVMYDQIICNDRDSTLESIK
jgi:hypothetical protein